ncbi:hypothetical protein [uncultured Pseudodesulfovibrio sp.]|uniref:hypothetical protein n=1 Tax=uncultured Pseudodesulfovibrio sp. TaxID=2035858 RepID=UPI0037478624
MNTISTRKETIRGVIVPEEWDNQFHVTKILIACKGEREIRVENLDRFPHLLGLSQKETLITGTVTYDGTMESIVIDSVDTL